MSRDVLLVVHLEDRTFGNGPAAGEANAAIEADNLRSERSPICCSVSVHKANLT